MQKQKLGFHADNTSFRFINWFGL